MAQPSENILTCEGNNGTEFYRLNLIKQSFKSTQDIDIHIPFNLSLLFSLLNHLDVKVICPVGHRAGVTDTPPTHHEVGDVTILLHIARQLQTAWLGAAHTPVIVNITFACWIFLYIQFFFL